MSRVAVPQGGTSPPSAPPNLDEITDEEFLKQMWQQAEDFGERRRIRARMYKLREQRLREMVQNDEESLGALTTITGEGVSSHTERSEAKVEVSIGQRKTSNIEVNLRMQGDTAVTDSITMQNVRLGGITMRGIEHPRKGSDVERVLSDEEIIDEQVKEVSKGRTDRYKRILDQYDQKNNKGDDALVSISKSTYSIQSNALTGDSYQSMKHKEVRDSVSPTRGGYGRRSATDDSDGRLTSDDEIVLRSASEDEKEKSNIIKAKSTEVSAKVSNSKIVSGRKLSKEIELSSRSDKVSSNITGKSQTEVSNRKQPSPKTSPTPTSKSSPTKKSSQPTKQHDNKKSKLQQIASKMDADLKNEYNKLDSYLGGPADPDDVLVVEEEEEAEDSSGNIVKMVVQTRRKKDGTEYSSRRIARTTKIVDSESDIDEILVGNPDHEVINRNVEEKEEEDGSKIKIITETRRRPDGIEYKTKNVLKTLKIFDYDHPENVTYSDEDELVESKESEEMDEQGIVIRTITEIRRKSNGVEYTTKKVYKTSKILSRITPSIDDEVLDSKITEEKQEDGTTVKIIIENRRTKSGEEYTHRQVYKTRKMTLSAIELEKGLPVVNSDDEVIGKKEKQETDETGTIVKIVTETRQRKDGSTYSFDYVLRNFKGTETDIERISINTFESSGISISREDKLLKEEVKEELQDDGSTIKTIIERREAKDGTKYLRHRILRIPKLPETKLHVASLEDEVLEEDFNEDVLEDGTHCRAVTERRRSSVTGLQYTLRRMSRVFQHSSHLLGIDEIIDENVTEEETADGVRIKTVIRRYQRADDSVYTTHDVSKTYTNPVSVSVDKSTDDELVDRSYDERETYDGYIIKTIMETRCRSDGVHYTIERIEKVSKIGHDEQISLEDCSILSGSPGDTVVSCEEHEEPGDIGILIKTILEIRRRTDGTEYTNKITIKTTQILVPQHETSYVVIKPDPKNEDNGFMPSLDDEIIYTRRREETDEKGNIINVTIETRQSKTTGEKYNLTKRVRTTDIVVTEDGEKILTKRSPAPKTTPFTPKPREVSKSSEKDKVPYGSVSSLKNRFAVPKTKEPTRTTKEKIDRTNTASKKMFFEDAAANSATPKTPSPKAVTRGNNILDRKNRFLEPKIKSTSRPISNKLKDFVKKPNMTSSDNSDTDNNKMQKPHKILSTPNRYEKDRIQHKEVGVSKSNVIPRKSPSPASSPNARKKIVTDIPLKYTKKSLSSDKSRSKVKSSDSSSELTSPGSRSPQRVSPTQEKRSKSYSRSSPKAVSPPSPRSLSSPNRERSPIRTATSSSREGTPGRQCCKRMHEAREATPVKQKVSHITPRRKEIPTEQQTAKVEVKRIYSGQRKEVSKVVDEYSKKKPQDLDRHNKPDRFNRSTASSGKTSPFKSPTKRSPISSTTERKSPSSKETIAKSRAKPGIKQMNNDSLYIPNEPIVSLPQTPMSVDTNVHPGEETPLIEDVSSDPNLPYHTIHRPSIVREVSDQPSEFSHSVAESRAVHSDSSVKPRVDSNISKRQLAHTESDSKFSDRRISKTSVSSEDETKKRSFASPKARKISPPLKTNRRKYSDDSSDDSKFNRRPSTEVILDKSTRLCRIGSPTIEKKEPIFSRSSRKKNIVDKTDSTLHGLDQSILSQIIPDGADSGRSVVDRYQPKERKTDFIRKSSVDGNSSVLSKRSIFEKVTEEKVSNFRPSAAKDKATRRPVIEPIIVAKYIHPLGPGAKEQRTETTDRPKLQDDDLSLTSTKLVLKTMSPEPKSPDVMRRKSTPKFDTESTVIKEDVNDIITPLKDRSPSPFSKESSPRPRSKEGSPSRFSKETSPGRFLTGKPIDQGANTTKIKRLERTGSNKKLYEDLEVPSAELIPLVETIETISEITVLQTLLQKAESYEERRIIRGRIRTLKRPVCTQPTAPAPYKRFVDTTVPAKPSPTTSPQLTRRPITTNLEGRSFGKSQTSSYKTETRDTRKNEETYEYKPVGTSETRETRETRRRLFSSGIESKEKVVSDNETSERITKRVSSDSDREKTTDDEIIRRKKSTETRSTVDKEQTRKTSSETRKTSFESSKYSSIKEFKRDSSDSEEKRYTKREETTDQRSDTFKQESRLSENERTSSVRRKGLSESTKAFLKAEKFDVTSEKSSSITSSDTRRKASEDVSMTTSKRIGSSTKSQTKDTSYQSSTRKKPTDTRGDTYSEPLRHQRGPSHPVTQTQQTHVEKIMSPYGVGPTDENGVPLFGLKALKRRNQTSDDYPEPKAPSYDQGSPDETNSSLFGGVKSMRTSAVKKTHDISENETVIDASVTKKEENKEVTSSITSRTRGKEISPALVSSVDKSLRRETKSTSESETEELNLRSKNLKNIILMHEAKVTEQSITPESPTRSQPKQRLRNTFEPTVETAENKPYRTWDLESDLVTRSDVVENIIAKHETLSQQDQRSEKRLTGILKKTSTASLTQSKRAEEDSETGSPSEDVYDRQLRKASRESTSETEEFTSHRSDNIERKTSYAEIVFSNTSPSNGDREKPVHTVTGELQKKKPSHQTIDTHRKRTKTDNKSKTIQKTRDREKTEGEVYSKSVKRKTSRSTKVEKAELTISSEETHVSTSEEKVLRKRSFNKYSAKGETCKDIQEVKTDAQEVGYAKNMATSKTRHISEKKSYKFQEKNDLNKSKTESKEKIRDETTKTKDRSVKKLKSETLSEDQLKHDKKESRRKHSKSEGKMYVETTRTCKRAEEKILVTSSSETDEISNERKTTTSNWNKNRSSKKKSTGSTSEQSRSSVTSHEELKIKSEKSVKSKKIRYAESTSERSVVSEESKKYQIEKHSRDEAPITDIKFKRRDTPAFLGDYKEEKTKGRSSHGFQRSRQESIKIANLSKEDASEFSKRKTTSSMESKEKHRQDKTDISRKKSDESSPSYSVPQQTVSLDASILSKQAEISRRKETGFNIIEATEEIISKGDQVDINVSAEEGKINQLQMAKVTEEQEETEDTKETFMGKERFQSIRESFSTQESKHTSKHSTSDTKYNFRKEAQMAREDITATYNENTDAFKEEDTTSSTFEGKKRTRHRSPLSKSSDSEIERAELASQTKSKKKAKEVVKQEKRRRKQNIQKEKSNLTEIDEKKQQTDVLKKSEVSEQVVDLSKIREHKSSTLKVTTQLSEKDKTVHKKSKEEKSITVKRPISKTPTSTKEDIHKPGKDKERDKKKKSNEVVIQKEQVIKRTTNEKEKIQLIDKKQKRISDSELHKSKITESRKKSTSKASTISSDQENKSAKKHKTPERTFVLTKTVTRKSNDEQTFDEKVVTKKDSSKTMKEATERRESQKVAVKSSLIEKISVKDETIVDDARISTQSRKKKNKKSEKPEEKDGKSRPVKGDNEHHERSSSKVKHHEVSTIAHRKDEDVIILGAKTSKDKCKIKGKTVTTKIDDTTQEHKYASRKIEKVSTLTSNSELELSCIEVNQETVNKEATEKEDAVQLQKSSKKLTTSKYETKKDVNAEDQVQTSVCPRYHKTNSELNEQVTVDGRVLRPQIHQEKTLTKPEPKLLTDTDSASQTVTKQTIESDKQISKSKLDKDAKIDINDEERVKDVTKTCRETKVSNKDLDTEITKKEDSLLTDYSELKTEAVLLETNTEQRKVVTKDTFEENKMECAINKQKLTNKESLGKEIISTKDISAESNKHKTSTKQESSTTKTDRHSKEKRTKSEEKRTSIVAKEAKDNTQISFTRPSPSRSSQSPESDELSNRLRKLSKKKGKLSMENVSGLDKKKQPEKKTSSLQSLSSVSTTSSLPNYMRPKGESSRRCQVTPERDQQDIEDILLNSYQYTRCTKKIYNPPVTYDYTYAINHDSKPAGIGAGTYSIYFGPRDKSPGKEINDSRVHGSTNIIEEYDIQRKQSTSSSHSKNELKSEKIEKNVQESTQDQELFHFDSNSVKNRDIYAQNKNVIDVVELGGIESSSKEHSSERTNQRASLRRDSETHLTNLGETYPEIRKQYLETVKNIDTHSKESLRKKQAEEYDRERRDFETTETFDVMQTTSHQTESSSSKFVYNEEIIHSNQNIVSTDQSSAIEYLAIPDIEPNLDLTTGSSVFKDFETTNIRDQKDELQQKYNYQVENQLKNFNKMLDVKHKDQESMHITTGLTSHLDTIESSDDKFKIDFNKVYADKLSKHRISDDAKGFTITVRENDQLNQSTTKPVQQTSTQQTSTPQTSTQQISKLETSSHYSDARNVQDDSYYVTFDGRQVKSDKSPDSSDTGNYKLVEQRGTDQLGNVNTATSLHSHRDVGSMHVEGISSPVESGFTTSPRSSFTRVESSRRAGQISQESSYQQEEEERVIKVLQSVTTDEDMREEKSFLNDRTKVSGITDVLSRMGATEAVDHEAKVTSDEQARSLLNKFLGAQVLMTGVESMMANSSLSDARSPGNVGQFGMTHQRSEVSRGGQVAEKRSTFSAGPVKTTAITSSTSQQSESFIVKGVNINEVADSFELNELLDSCEEYEERRRIRLRLKEVVAREKEEFAAGHDKLNSSTRRTAGVSRVTTLGSKGADVRSSEGTSRLQDKGQSAFDKFKLVDPQQPGSKSAPKVCGPLFTLSTSLNRSASGVKDMILTWCQCRTRYYKGVKIENFSTSWNDGMAFCALIHHFYPDAFDFASLDQKNRRYNFTLAFRVADEKAGVFPLLDVEDMVIMKKPDWKCVFTYVQALYKRLKDE